MVEIFVCLNLGRQSGHVYDGNRANYRLLKRHERRLVRRADGLLSDVLAVLLGPPFDIRLRPCQRLFYHRFPRSALGQV
ncbi:hypothetical protein GWI33_006423 [Rhynchophorus ferrugineus]|uniref:Uncharacterized protein n=1 Tax=Rhynchophorus ferrugineus TaxID=354439 RepID=A0A834IJ32_RHYFE|nr:hypothetical protein GWI33_006423 [Rhynchophorus ferrugineus]